MQRPERSRVTGDPNLDRVGEGTPPTKCHAPTPMGLRKLPRACALRARNSSCGRVGGRGYSSGPALVERGSGLNADGHGGLSVSLSRLIGCSVGHRLIGLLLG